jgi:uncharacterized cupin superfamily protein
MPTIFQQSDLKFQEDTDSIDKFRIQTAIPRLSKLVGSKHLVFDVRVLPQGEYSFPYHFHRNAEELILILSGSFTMRSPDGFKVISQGDLVFFEMGDTSAHQFYNHESVPCTYLDIRTVAGIDVCEYPDSGKINVWPFGEIFSKDSKVDYFHGEENVDGKWDAYRQGRD